MTHWVQCPGCSGEVGLPADWDDESIACPNCGASVGMVDANSKAKWRPSRVERAAIAKPQAGSWMAPCGVVFTSLGVVGFLASAYVSWPEGNRYSDLGKLFIAVFSGTLNPTFFIGFPLGMYWLYRSGVLGKDEGTGQSVAQNRTNVGGNRPATTHRVPVPPAAPASSAPEPKQPTTRAVTPPSREHSQLAKDSETENMAGCAWFILLFIAAFFVLISLSAL